MPYRSLLAACYFGYFVSGLLLTVIGPILPAMQESFRLSFSQVGPAFVVQSAGFSISVLAGGAVSDSYGRRSVLLWGGSLLALALFGFLIPAGWSFTLLCFFMTGAGFGLVDASLNSLAVDLSPGAEGRALNLLHLFPAVGAVLGPHLGAYLVGHGWRWPLGAVGIGVVAFLLWLWFEPFPSPSPANRGAASHGRESFLAVASHPLILTLAAVMALYVGAELAVSGWTVTYASVALGASTAFGAGVTSLFWIGLAIGRLLCGAAAARIAPLTLVTACSVGAMLTFLPAVRTQDPTAFAWSIALSGACLGGIFPTIVGYAGASFPRRVGTVTGFIIAVCSVGGATVGALVGVIADRSGMGAGLSTVLVASALMAAGSLAASAIERRLARDERRHCAA